MLDGEGVVLSLDLGSNTGFVLTKDNQQNIVGTWEFKNSRHEGGGSRYLRFRQKLNETHTIMPIGRVFYEEVRRHAGTDAAHVYGGLLGILTAFCEEHSIPYEGIPVGTIKKHWTGKGNASKEMMIEVAESKGFEVDNDNEADALAISSWAFANRIMKAIAAALLAALAVSATFTAAAGALAEWTSYADYLS